MLNIRKRREILRWMNLNKKLCVWYVKENDFDLLLLYLKYTQSTTCCASFVEYLRETCTQPQILTNGEFTIYS